MRTNIFAVMLHYGPARREEVANRIHVEGIIEFLELEACRDVPVGRLPYGVQKRIELGRALAAEPALLLLDEPMAGMNQNEKRDMSRFILEINRQFGTANCPHRARHRGDHGHIASNRGSGPRRQDRRGAAQRHHLQSGGDRGVSRRRPLITGRRGESTSMWF